MLLRGTLVALAAQSMLFATDSSTAQSDKRYRCTVESVAVPPQTSRAQADYLKKQHVGGIFVVERRTGVMSGVLDNSYGTKPRVIDHGSAETSYKVVNTIPKERTGGNIYALVVNEYVRGETKPFVFMLNDEIYFGTCVGS